MAGLYRHLADGKPGEQAFGLLRALDTFMRLCRRSPVLNELVRRPLSSLWLAGMRIYFALRNRVRSPICTLRVHGFRFSVDLRDSVVARHLYCFGTYEAAETELVGRLVRPGMTVVDLGANVGYYTLLFGKLVGARGRVLAFEPEPDNFMRLEQNIAAGGLSNIQARRSAVAEEAGETHLCLSPANFGAHHIRPPGAEDRRVANNEISVPCVTLDDVIGRRDPPVDFLKMDIEGAEFRALQGMRRVLGDSPNIMIMSEYNHSALRAGGADPEAFLEALAELGFRFFAIHRRCRLKALSISEISALKPRDKNINLLISRAVPSVLPARAETG